MSDTPKTIEVIKPCNHSQHEVEDDNYIIGRALRDLAAHCPGEAIIDHEGEELIDLLGHEGAKVITLTEPIQWCATHHATSPRHMPKTVLSGTRRVWRAWLWRQDCGLMISQGRTHE